MSATRVESSYPESGACDGGKPRCVNAYSMEAVAKANSQVVEGRCGCGEAGQKHERLALATPVYIVQPDSVRLDEVFREQATGFVWPETPASVRHARMNADIVTETLPGWCQFTDSSR